MGITCNDQGVCDCHPNFVKTKCEECAEDRYNYPLCEPCNCNPAGVVEKFFDMGGCKNVAPGTLCTCKERVTGRICDTCKPLYWNLQSWMPEACDGKRRALATACYRILRFLDD